ncbi:MAG: GNAT family N-acetyltransferase [Bacteroidota bacterium]|nr:GNAT family N-acetyltransferase [Bacteroidota bacterium]
MITLEEISLKYKVSFVTLLKNENVSRWLLTIPFPYTLKDAEEFIKRCNENKNSKEDYPFAIENNGIHIGGIGLHKKGEHKAEIGYWLGEEYWNKSFMTEALNKMTDFGFNKLNLKRIYAGIFEDNIASEKLLLKCDFEYEGLLRKNLKKGNKLISEKIFAKVVD